MLLNLYWFTLNLMDLLKVYKISDKKLIANKIRELLRKTEITRTVYSYSYLEIWRDDEIVLLNFSIIFSKRFPIFLISMAFLSIDGFLAFCWSGFWPGKCHFVNLRRSSVIFMPNYVRLKKAHRLIMIFIIFTWFSFSL